MSFSVAKFSLNTLHSADRVLFLENIFLLSSIGSSLFFFYGPVAANYFLSLESGFVRGRFRDGGGGEFILHLISHFIFFSFKCL